MSNFWEFKNEQSFEDRKAISERLRNKFPDRIPVIIQYAPNLSHLYSSNTEGNLENTNFYKKYLVPSNVSLLHLQCQIREDLQINETQGLFMLINKSALPLMTNLIQHLYDRHKDDDDFLYVLCSGENTFGFL